MMNEIKGWHVLAGFVLMFGTIIAVNMTLAVNAVRTFPGLVVANSYVASQSFDADRAAQEALGWESKAWLEGGRLHLKLSKDGRAIEPQIEEAVFGRATHVAEDQQPEFAFDGSAFVADVDAPEGRWTLRLAARAADGTAFVQVLEVERRL